MEIENDLKNRIPQDLKTCVEFHGHLCPGLIYGYIVSKEAMNKMNLNRSRDEEIVTITENDSCAVDAFQVMLGCTQGKGNLIFKDYGKNAYTVISRSSGKAYRFSRRSEYQYQGKDKDEFDILDGKISDGTATHSDRIRQKMLKSMDLLEQPFENIFHTSDAPSDIPPYAELARSKACGDCGEMTMETKMVRNQNDTLLCIPCSGKS